jgi:kynureninase
VKCRSYLFTDIIQAAGCISLDLEKEEVDFAAAQAAKWLLGPVGAGFVYVRKSIIDEIRPRFLGWWGVKNIEDFSFHDLRHCAASWLRMAGAGKSRAEIVAKLNAIRSNVHIMFALETLEYLLISKSWWDMVDTISTGALGLNFKRFPKVCRKYLAKWRKAPSSTAILR